MQASESCETEKGRRECKRIVHRSAIEWFYGEMCRRAEAKMLETQKLEGAHYAAATEIIAEMRRGSE